MNRRNFAKTIAGAVTGTAFLSQSNSIAHAQAVKLPFSLSVMLWTVFQNVPFEQRLEKVSEAGYKYVELTGEFLTWSDADFKRFNTKKHSLGMTFDACWFGLATPGLADPAAGDKLVGNMKGMLDTADRLECSTIILLTGDQIEGVSMETQHAACITTLSRVGELAAKRNVSLLIESIDRAEMPKHYLNTATEGFEIVRKVDNPHVKFLYDLYHEQITAGNLIEKLQKNIDLIGLVHVAEVPGRHEPGTGEIDYASIYRKLVELKFSRTVAMEFMPTGDQVTTLRAAREMVYQAAKRTA